MRELVKQVLIDRLNLSVTPDEIGDEAILFGPRSEHGLDSVDSLEFILGLEQAFKLKFPDYVPAEVFLSINTVVDYLEKRLAEGTHSA
jgi:acyl carrier protein